MSRFREIVYASDDVLSIKKNIHELYSTVPIELNREIYQFAGLKGMETLLDIGCGTGDFLMYLRKDRDHSGILFGADLASGVFEKNKDISTKEGLNINFLEASILQIPFQTNTVDVITALHMLSHVPLGQAFRESERVIKKGGKFIATANSLKSYPNVDKYREMAFNMMGWGLPLFTTSSFNLENMKEILSDYWPSVNIKDLQGELKIPTNEFLRYFYANMMIWEPMPSEKESEAILEMVSKQLSQDAPEGFVIEPKYIGIAVCEK